MERQPKEKILTNKIDVFNFFITHKQAFRKGQVSTTARGEKGKIFILYFTLDYPFLNPKEEVEILRNVGF